MEAWHHGAGTILLDRVSHLIERLRGLYPARVIGAKTGGEDDCTEAAQLDAVGGRRDKRRGRRHLRHLRSAGRATPSDQLTDVAVAGVAEGPRLGEVGREMGAPVISAKEAPQEVHAQRLQGSVVEVMPPTVAAQLGVCA